MKFVMAVLLMGYTLHGYAQVEDDFSDGDYMSAPAWAGNPTDWLVNVAGQLQSASNTANTSFYLSTPNSLATQVQWDLYVRLNFNTSSANYCDIWLIASSADLASATTTGYFVRIGNSQDEISLYRKDQATVTRIIDGMDGLTNASDNAFRLRVVRDANNRFTLFRDATGSGLHYIPEGSVQDATYTSSAFFGLLVKQSTASFFGRHYFDDIRVQPFVPDTLPPDIQSVEAVNGQELDIIFSEALDSTSAGNTAHFTLDHGAGPPLTIHFDPLDPSAVRLVFSPGFVIDTHYQIAISGIQDLWGNAISTSTAAFSFHPVRRYDLEIDEILPDPTPPVGLPPYEFVELKNRSGHVLQLQGMRLRTSGSQGSTLPRYQLPPDSFIILTAPSSASAFSGWGRTIGLQSFPSLDNDSGVISLLSKEGSTIHAVAYSASWYEGSLKANGGWSLEMMDVNEPCLGKENWKASTGLGGGSPGKINTVASIVEDNTPPQLLRTYTIDSLTIVASFNESLDSLASSLPTSYQLNGQVVLSAMPVPPLFREVVLKLQSALQPGQVSELTVSHVPDCNGNEIGSYNKAKAGLPQAALPGNLVINEILFHPHPGGSDYVEVYNNSGKVMDLSTVLISSRNVTGNISTGNIISPAPRLIFPREYFVLTASTKSLADNYFVKDPSTVIEEELPSLPNEGGSVVLLDPQGNILDEVDYREDWHFPLITNTEGISLERLDPSGPSNKSSNWHSAAATAGWGTPGYINSQYREDVSSPSLSVEPPVFSPDNDGHDDVAIISYRRNEPGWVASITIFDAGGHLVRRLANNELLGMEGKWTWDGLDENKAVVRPGIFIILISMFDLKDKSFQSRKTIVLARNMQ